jgi:hypothetical protein
MPIVCFNFSRTNRRWASFNADPEALSNNDVICKHWYACLAPDTRLRLFPLLIRVRAAIVSQRLTGAKVIRQQIAVLITTRRDPLDAEFFVKALKAGLQLSA